MMLYVPGSGTACGDDADAAEDVGEAVEVEGRCDAGGEVDGIGFAGV